jgi:hypothetical protein
MGCYAEVPANRIIRLKEYIQGHEQRVASGGGTVVNVGWARVWINARTLR